jgi:hypothetical protein
MKKDISMFGIFKKKSTAVTKIDPLTQQLLAGAAEMLELDLLLCKADTNKYNNFFRSNFVRGYLVGFFDSAIQNAGVTIINDGHFISLISIGHSYLIGDIKKSSLYAVDSLALQGDQEFDNAQIQGGEMHFNFMNGSIRVPNGLSIHFHKIQRADA